MSVLRNESGVKVSGLPTGGRGRDQGARPSGVNQSKGEIHSPSLVWVPRPTPGEYDSVREGVP